MAYTKGDSPMRRRGGRRRRKVCAFCTEADAVIDYKDVATLKKYVSEKGKILPIRGILSSVYVRFLYIHRHIWGNAYNSIFYN